MAAAKTKNPEVTSTNTLFTMVHPLSKWALTHPVPKKNKKSARKQSEGLRVVVALDRLFLKSHAAKNKPNRLLDELGARHLVIDHRSCWRQMQLQNDGQMMTEPTFQAAQHWSVDRIAGLHCRPDTFLDFQNPAGRQM